MKKSLSNKFIYPLGLFAVLTGSAIGGPVVVTPGSTAGYLYFPPAAVAGGGGSASEYHPVFGGCEKVTNIGDQCYWADGVSMLLAAKTTGAITKYFISDVEPLANMGCDSTVASDSTGKVNAASIATCPAAVTCRAKGTGFIVPSYSELQLIWSNRATLGLSATKIFSSSSTPTMTGQEPQAGRKSTALQQYLDNGAKSTFPRHVQDIYNNITVNGIYLNLLCVRYL